MCGGGVVVVGGRGSSETVGKAGGDVEACLRCRCRLFAAVWASVARDMVRLVDSRSSG